MLLASLLFFKSCFPPSRQIVFFLEILAEEYLFLFATSDKSLLHNVSVSVREGEGAFLLFFFYVCVSNKGYSCFFESVIS